MCFTKVLLIIILGALPILSLFCQYSMILTFKVHGMTAATADNGRFGSSYRLHLQDRKHTQAKNIVKQVVSKACFTMVFCLLYSPTTKMEETYSSETPVSF
jgi:hypothetical protein